MPRNRIWGVPEGHHRITNVFINKTPRALDNVRHLHEVLSKSFIWLKERSNKSSWKKKKANPSNATNSLGVRFSEMVVKFAMSEKKILKGRTEKKKKEINTCRRGKEKRLDAYRDFCFVQAEISLPLGLDEELDNFLGHIL